MKRQRVAAIIITVLLVPGILSSGVFFMPRTAKADAIDIPFLTTIATATGHTAILKTLSNINQVVNTVANVATQVNQYVLQPIAFIASGKLLKSITSSVVSFVDGASNGLGSKQFIQNLQSNLQTLGDSVALGKGGTSGFFSQFNANSNSPFASSITKELHAIYLQQTSVSGFFGQIKNTLLDTVNGSTQQLNNFLAGDWSQGGVATWFALTTKEQNNPYTLYNLTQNEMSSIVANAQSSRQQEAAWSGGFVGWCGTGSKTNPGSGLNTYLESVTLKAEAIGVADLLTTMEAADVANIAANDIDTSTGIFNSSALQDITQALEGYKITPTQANKVANDIITGVTASVSNSIGLGVRGSSVTVGDPCTNNDGSPGTIETPGSVIQDALSKATDYANQKLVGLGSAAKDISSILSGVKAIASTVGFAKQLLGGTNGGGLANLQSTTGNSQNQSGYLGETTANVYQSITGSGTSTITAFAANIDTYAKDWQIIAGSLNNTTTSLQSLVVACKYGVNAAKAAKVYLIFSGITIVLKKKIDSEISTFNQQITTTLSTLSNTIGPIITEQQQASTTIANARSLLVQAQQDQASGNQAAYLNDIQQIQGSPPAASDLQQVQADIQTQGIPAMAVDNPTGSLSVSGGSLINQLNLIAENAQILIQSCVFVP